MFGRRVGYRLAARSDPARTRMNRSRWRWESVAGLRSRPKNRTNIPVAARSDRWQVAAVVGVTSSPWMSTSRPGVSGSGAASFRPFGSGPATPAANSSARLLALTRSRCLSDRVGLRPSSRHPIWCMPVFGSGNTRTRFRPHSPAPQERRLRFVRAIIRFLSMMDRTICATEGSRRAAVSVRRRARSGGMLPETGSATMGPAAVPEAGRTGAEAEATPTTPPVTTQTQAKSTAPTGGDRWSAGEHPATGRMGAGPGGSGPAP